MIWKELSIYTTSEAVEIVADTVQDVNLGVAILDQNDVIDLLKNQKNWDYIDENVLQNWDYAVVKTFLPIDDFETNYRDIQCKLELLKQNSEMNLGSLEIITNEIDDEVWFENWKKFFHQFEIGKLTICPIWEKCEANGACVMIEPGLAFGTGEHETTALCLDALQRVEPSNKTVIDVGCGSGILGIAAHKLGAKSVYMCDIDPLAVKSAKQNAELNCCQNLITIEQKDLLSETDQKADIILVNIVADVLIEFSSKIAKHLNATGTIVLSGIIHKRLNDVIVSYETAGFKCKKVLTKGEWNAVILQN